MGNASRAQRQRRLFVKPGHVKQREQVVEGVPPEGGESLLLGAYVAVEGVDEDGLRLEELLHVDEGRVELGPGHLERGRRHQPGEQQPATLRRHSPALCPTLKQDRRDRLTRSPVFPPPTAMFANRHDASSGSRAKLCKDVASFLRQIPPPRAPRTRATEWEFRRNVETSVSGPFIRAFVRGPTDFPHQVNELLGSSCYYYNRQIVLGTNFSFPPPQHSRLSFFHYSFIRPYVRT
jgi:hypothetical protein